MLVYAHAALHQLGVVFMQTIGTRVKDLARRAEERVAEEHVAADKELPPPPKRRRPKGWVQSWR
jgi:hypothetical protein